MDRQHRSKEQRSTRWRRTALVGFLIGANSLTAWAVDDRDLIALLHQPAAEHADQLELFTLVSQGHDEEAFELAFELGDELFETRFNMLDGVGANVGDGHRFTRIPRADLRGNGEWANHFPRRATGPNAEACNACHNLPFDDGAGLAAANVHRDPQHGSGAAFLIQRNTPHVFALGALQRVAEEMTAELHALRVEAEERVCENPAPVGEALQVKLVAKGVHFGMLTVKRGPTNPPEAIVDSSQVVGIGADLVVRPFQWKGSIAFLRDFNRDASHNELGMQAVELVGEGVDGDGDGISGEMTIGDQTALTIYLAAQPRPTTLSELNELGLVEPALTRAQEKQLSRGRTAFRDIGCADCHTPEHILNDPNFSEPSQSPHYRDTIFPGGQEAIATGVDPDFPVSFDLTEDQPDNQVIGPRGELVKLGALRKDRQGRAIVELYGDLKRHDLGPALGEYIDEIGSGSSVYMTENLWGVGSTAPYLHDGRATTLTEAILAHGGEAEAARDRFKDLPLSRQLDLIAFLGNLVLFKMEEPEGATAAPRKTVRNPQFVDLTPGA